MSGTATAGLTTWGVTAPDEAAVVSLRHRTHRPGAGSAHGRTLRREARTVSTALASLAAASLLSGSVVSFAEQRKERAVHELAPVVRIGAVGDGRGRVDGEVTALAVEIGGRAPGSIDEGCVVVAYGRGSAGPGSAAALRVTGRVDPVTPSTTTASAFIEVGSGIRADCADFVGTSVLYAGDLHRLAAEHGDRADGLPLADRAALGTTVTLRLVVSTPPSAGPPPVVTPFWLDVEARPAAG